LADDEISGSLGGLIKRRPVALLVLFALLAWLPGFFTLPPLDRDESRFAQASKQMLETGDFVQIRLGDEARAQKPVGIYWLQAASTAILSPILPDGAEQDTIWTYRIPSLAGALSALLLTFFLVRAFASVETAFFAALILGSTLILMVEAHIAKTDAFLLAMILGAQSFLMRTYLSVRKPEDVPAPSFAAAMAGWACFGFGILVKGPIILGVCGATVLAVSVWDRDWRWLARLRPLSGFALALLIVVPWLIAIGIATDGAFFAGSLGDDFASKLIGEQESHGAPPGYFTLLVFVTFWPAVIVLLPGVLFAVTNRRNPAVRFLLLWAVTTWIMFEAAPTKLPHYTLPAYPALAILSAMWLTQAPANSSGRVESFFRAISPVIFLAIAAVLAGALLWLPSSFGDGTPIVAYGVAGMGFVFALAAVRFMSSGRRREGFTIAAFAGVVFYALAWQVIAPTLIDFQLSTRIAEAVEMNTQPGDPPVVIAGYAEPSIRFLLGTDTVLTTGEPAGELAVQHGGLVVISDQEGGAFVRGLGDGLLRAARLDAIEGVNYSNGRRLSLTLFRVLPE
jgi:4-amino-4-deoxy-L-arabinose transferase-like glycosyltransferase